MRSGVSFSLFSHYLLNLAHNTVLEIRVLSEESFSHAGLTHKPDLLTLEAEQRSQEGEEKGDSSKCTGYFGGIKVGVVCGSSDIEVEWGVVFRWLRR